VFEEVEVDGTAEYSAWSCRDKALGKMKLNEVYAEEF